MLVRRALALLILAVTGLGAPPRSAGAGATCDPADPPTCTLAELAARHGVRFGATAEPDEVGPGSYADVLRRELSSLTPERTP